MIPTILGFPLWRGRIKNRVAKKYLSRHHPWMLENTKMNDLGVSDLVNDHTPFNGRIRSMKARYRRITKHGEVLIDVAIMTENTACSFQSILINKRHGQVLAC